jgi:hypothetical protein
MCNKDRLRVAGIMVFAAIALFLLAGISGCVAPSINAPTLAAPAGGATPLAATVAVAPADETPTATPLGADETLQPFQPVGAIELPALAGSSVTSMTIVESWTGLSPVAPIEATFHLTPAPQGLKGVAHFSAAGYRDPITATASISIPVEILNQFLVMLAGTPLEEGPYQPLINHTDDYPSIALIVETSAGQFTFDTQSQGETHVPWRALIEGREYVTYADNPAQAWRLLDPYLARPIQTALIEQAQ